MLTLSESLRSWCAKASIQNILTLRHRAQRHLLLSRSVYAWQLALTVDKRKTVTGRNITHAHMRYRRRAMKKAFYFCASHAVRCRRLRVLLLRHLKGAQMKCMVCCLRAWTLRHDMFKARRVFGMRVAGTWRQEAMAASLAQWFVCAGK